VIKPAIASTGYGLMRVDRTTAVEGQQHVARLAEEGDYVIQVFLGEVLETGELSVVFIDGEYTHAVRKRGADGEIKVHEEFGGTDELADPTESEMELSRRSIHTTRNQVSEIALVRVPPNNARRVSEGRHRVDVVSPSDKLTCLPHIVPDRSHDAKTATRPVYLGIVPDYRSSIDSLRPEQLQQDAVVVVKLR